MSAYGMATRQRSTNEAVMSRFMIDEKLPRVHRPPEKRRWKQKMKTTLTAIALAFALTGPAIAADDAKSVVNQINQKWVDASAKGDAAAWAALYTKDGSVLPQGAAEPIMGEANVRKFFDGIVAGPKPAKFTTTVSEATMLDPKIILANGTYALDFPGQSGGATTHVTGTYFAVDVLDGSTWKIRSNTWNEMPPPSAQPPANK
jgi:uncharacterized protein (TIGR02246 family)